MSYKGMQAQRDFSKRRTEIRNGRLKPIEYTMTLKQALKAAGLQ
jgi:hypothetical protein